MMFHFKNFKHCNAIAVFSWFHTILCNFMKKVALLVKFPILPAVVYALTGPVSFVFD